MKNSLFIVAVLFCACNPIRTDLGNYALNCKAQEVIVQSDSLELPYTAFFNGKGQLDSVCTRNFDGSPRFKESYIYDERSRLKEVYGINSEGDYEVRYEYEIDGKFIKECRVYGMNNQEIHRWVHENDGRHIVHTVYYGEGEEEYIIKKKFSGSHYTEESYTPDGELTGRAEVDFFRDDNKPTCVRGDQMDIDIQYNSKGLPEISRNATLNSKGELEWVPGLEENPFRYFSYEYDERGNWISRAERIHPDSTAISVLHRIIKY